MEELAKALAEAIRTGSQLAPSALIGYYIVSVIKAVAAPLATIVVVATIARTVRQLSLRYADIEEARNDKAGEQ